MEWNGNRRGLLRLAQRCAADASYNTFLADGVAEGSMLARVDAGHADPAGADDVDGEFALRRST